MQVVEFWNNYSGECVGTTAKEIVVEAARTIPTPFSIGSLTIACWLLNPDKFGLQPYPKVYPDSTPVRVALFGKTGLIAKGIIRKVEGGYVLEEDVIEDFDESICPHGNRRFECGDCR